MNIHGKYVVLRSIEEEDLELLRESFNSREIENLVVGWSWPISKKEQAEWFLNNKNDGINHRFIIDTPEDKSIGLVNLISLDWKNRSAFHGIKLFENKSRRKGVGTDSVMAIMRYAFDELQLHRLEGAWFAENVASVSMYKKCGWVEEGIKKSCIYKQGAYRDLVITRILESEYYDLIHRNHYWNT